MTREYQSHKSSAIWGPKDILIFLQKASVIDKRWAGEHSTILTFSEHFGRTCKLLLFIVAKIFFWANVK